MQTPQNIKAITETQTLELHWSPDDISKLPFRRVRINCPCAECVDEVTHVRVLQPANVPMDISIKSAELMGNYALKIFWSDGHDTGLFTWDRLRALENAPDE